TNLTQNEPLSALTVVTSVTNPDGSARFTRAEQLVQLLQGGLKDYSYALPLGFAAPGTYSASLSVRDSGGTVLATNNTSCGVLSSAAAGAGLKGTLAASPKPVTFGDPIAFNATVSNLGNADLAALALTITVVDPASAQVLAQFPTTLALAKGQNAPLSS